MWHVPEQYRVTEEIAGKLKKMYGVPDRLLAVWLSMKPGEPEGFFILPHPKTMKGMFLLVKGSCGEGWEHVSVSIPTEDRCPTWPEMCFVKDLFWSDDDVVVQFHPQKKDYVNNHEFCLHLWRKKEENFETPPSILVGIKPK